MEFSKFVEKTSRVWSPTVDIRFSVFPAGEHHVEVGPIPDDVSTVRIELRSTDADSIMMALLAADAIRQRKVDVKVTAVFKYLPYGRQDRVTKEGEAFSLKVFADVLLTRFDAVEAVDPHSKATAKVFGGAFRERPVNYRRDAFGGVLGRVGKRFNNPIDNAVAVAPDTGAVKRMRRFMSDTGTKNQVLLEKTRKLSGVSTEISTFGYDVKPTDDLYIIDDICDGGATFISAATTLRANLHFDKLFLVVSHGLFTNGLPELEQWFEEIYVYNN